MGVEPVSCPGDIPVAEQVGIDGILLGEARLNQHIDFVDVGLRELSLGALCGGALCGGALCGGGLCVGGLCVGGLCVGGLCVGGLHVAKSFF